MTCKEQYFNINYITTILSEIHVLNIIDYPIVQSLL